MALTERVAQDYQNWTQSGDQAWTIVSDTSARSEASDADAVYRNVIEKSFDLDGGTREATLFVRGRIFTQEVYDVAGTAHATIKILDPDGVWHELYDESGGNGTAQTLLDSIDISDILSKEGTYKLQFIAEVGAYKVGAAWNLSYVMYTTMTLMAALHIDFELDLSEDVSVTEIFVQGLSLLEDVSVQEFFTIAKTTPLAATDEKLLAAKTDSKVYEFEQGTPAGIFDTKDEDFNLPGQEKTLAEIHLSSSAEAPHTVEVQVSTDASLTWTTVGIRVLSIGAVAIIFAWLTDEAFTIRFKGAGLHLDSFTLYAIPRGQEAPVTD